MSKLMRPSLAVLMFLSIPLSQAEEREPALAYAFEDPQLEWGPCPAFIPEGCEIASLHGDLAKNNADIFFKVPGNFTIPAHRHTSAERMVLVSGELHVKYEGQETTVLKPGMYAYGPSQRPHEAFCVEGAPCVLFIGFEEPVDAMPIEHDSSLQ